MTSSQPLVSVITPCYNYGAFLSEALASVMHQSYSNWECIIINDGSVDNTEEIALQYTNVDPRFKYVYQENAGLSGARNTALRYVKGKYIQLLDADDLLEKDKLSLQIELMEQNQEIDLVYSSMKIFYNNTGGKRIYKPFKLQNDVQVTANNEAVINALIEDNFFLPGCVLAKLSLYTDVGKFNEGLYGMEDWNYWSKAALLGKYFYHDGRENTMLLCRDHDSNMSKVHQKMLNARIYARRDVIESIKKLKAQQATGLTKPFVYKAIRQHKVLLLNDTYIYNSLYGKGVSSLKALFSYSLYSGKPIFFFEKLFQSLQRRIALK